MRALFILGLNDSRMIEVGGYDRTGQMIYNWPGNAVFHTALPLKPEEKNFVFIVWNNEPKRKITRPDIVVNCINDADLVGKSLYIACNMARSFEDRWPGVPIFNHPDYVLLTTRENIYSQYKDYPGITVPKVVKVKAMSPDHLLEIATREHRFKFPFLIRPAGSHQGEGLQRIDSMSDRPKLERYVWDGEIAYYLTQYVDYKDPDGLYRKARLVGLGGELLPRHFMTGDDWLVADTHMTYMAKNPAAREVEQRFLNNWEKMMRPEALESLRKIYEKRKLDYLGFDFSIRPDGSVLIFEINPAQNPFTRLDPQLYPYMGPVQERLLRALDAAVRKKAADAPKAA